MSNATNATTPAAFELDGPCLWTDKDGEQHEATLLALGKAGWATIDVDGTERKVRLSSLEAVEAEDDGDDSEADPEQDGDDEGEEGSSNLATQMRKYRASYVAGTNATGSKTLTNGDDLAASLLALLPLQVCAAADTVFEELAGHHAARYASLNPGQQRMNSGNRIRAFLRKAEDKAEAAAVVALAIKAALATPA